MWRGLIEKLSDDYKFYPPASDLEIAEAEDALGVAFPAELRTFLGETDGLGDKYGGGLVWPAGQIKATNLEFRRSPDFRESHQPFDSLLFFGNEANGDQFAFRFFEGAAGRDIFVWDHETDDRLLVAPSLEKYIELRLRGALGY